MIVGTIIVFALIPVVALVANAVEDSNREISFDSVYGESGLPVVTLSNDGKIFNFLVDTGANLSLINASHLNDLKHEKIAGEGTLFGMEGNVQRVEFVTAILSHNKDNFNVEFQVTNLDNAFNMIEKKHGILIHGVLGTEFLEANKGKIDFIKHKLKYGKVASKEDKATLEGQSK